MSPAAIAALLAAGCTFALLAGCGGEEEAGTPALTPPSEAGEGGVLRWAVAGRAETIDPLAADTRAELLLTRQIHEPLVAELASPFGETRREPGLARRMRASSGESVWTFVLREGVRFGDGTPLDSAAVLANARRWQAEGARLVPGLAAVDAPRPDAVRFILAAPDPLLPERLADPRLGLVSPRALPDAGGELRRVQGTGTGAFELRERDDDELLLAHNTSWWGTASGLGPALDQLLFRSEPNAALRLAMLEAGDAQLADELPPGKARLARRNPLLTTLPGPGGRSLALERSVRGVRSAREVPYLAGAWLTTIRVAD